MNALVSSIASALPGSPAHPSPNPLSSAPVPSGWPRLGDQIPQSGGFLLRAFGRMWLRVLGWRMVGDFPNIPRFVAIVAPHTSNWDFIVGLGAKFALGLSANWFGKDAIFRSPLGWLFRRMGGIPVDRSNTHNMVDQSVQAFAERSRMVLALAPEGTRKKVEQWRSGFWHIAHGAQVPIVCVAFDWATKEVRLGPTFAADDADAESGIARIQQAYVGVRGYDPSKQT